MTEIEKEKIRFWRLEGLGYGTIAGRMGLSENTVKSFCRRNGLSGAGAKDTGTFCRYCGQSLVPGRQGRKFCSEACRRAWWKVHPDLVDRIAFYSFTCSCCGKSFQSYGNRARKFCSHACYISARFGGGEGDE